MKVSELIAKLQVMPADAHLMMLDEGRLYELELLDGAIIPIERGHYDKSRHAGPHIGFWWPEGKVDRCASHLIKVEAGQAVLIRV